MLSESKRLISHTSLSLENTVHQKSHHDQTRDSLVEVDVSDRWTREVDSLVEVDMSDRWT